MIDRQAGIPEADATSSGEASASSSSGQPVPLAASPACGGPVPQGTLGAGRVSASCEVTQEMMDVGAEIISQFEFGWGSPRDFARRVFLAMAEKSPRPISEQSG